MKEANRLCLVPDSEIFIRNNGVIDFIAINIK